MSFYRTLTSTRRRKVIWIGGSITMVATLTVAIVISFRSDAPENASLISSVLGPAWILVVVILAKRWHEIDERSNRGSHDTH